MNHGFRTVWPSSFPCGDSTVVNQTKQSPKSIFFGVDAACRSNVQTADEAARPDPRAWGEPSDDDASSNKRNWARQTYLSCASSVSFFALRSGQAQSRVCLGVKCCHQLLKCRVKRCLHKLRPSNARRCSSLSRPGLRRRLGGWSLAV